MPTVVSSDHPRQKLIFYVAQDVSDEIRRNVRELVEQIARSRSWLIAPPHFVDTVDAVEGGAADAPIETVGGELEIYSALPPAGLPKEVDRQHFEEVEALIEAVRRLSEREHLAFELELGGTYVGAIEDGEVDRTLKVGLLDEWRRHVSA